MYVSVQGKILKSDEFAISPYADGLVYGAGLFETLKYQGDQMHFLPLHLKRLRESASRLGMELTFTDDQIEGFLKDMISFYEADRGVLKINLIRDLEEDLLIISRRENTYVPKIYEKGFRVKVSAWRRNERSLLVSMKTDNYLENILEFRKAKKDGYDEVLFMNSHDELAECSLSNLFFVKDGVLMTPEAKCGILMGVMRDRILDLARKFDIMVEQGCYQMADLEGAQEVFVTNSVMEIMPVASVEGHFQGVVPGNVTRRLMEAFQATYNK